MAKRPSLASLTAKKPAAQEQAVESQPAETVQASTAPSRPTPAYKGILAKVDQPTIRQLKLLAIDEDRPQTDLFVEAINLLFEKYNLPQIAAKVSPPRTK